MGYQDWRHCATVSTSAAVQDESAIRELMATYGIQADAEAEYGHSRFHSPWTYQITDSGRFDMAGEHPQAFAHSDAEYDAPLPLLALLSQFIEADYELMFCGDFHEKHSPELEAEKWRIQGETIECSRLFCSTQARPTGIQQNQVPIREILDTCEDVPALTDLVKR